MKVTEVTKIRVLDDMVRVTLDNDSLDEPLRLYMTIEDYFRYKVTVHSFMDGSYVASLLEQQEVYKATRSALRRLSSRDYAMAWLSAAPTPIRGRFTSDPFPISDLIQLASSRSTPERIRPDAEIAQNHFLPVK